MIKKIRSVVLSSLLVVGIFAPLSEASAVDWDDNPEVVKLRLQLKQFIEERRLVEKNLTTFDDLDFNVFNNQKWEQLHRSHSETVIVHWPDGRITEGIQAHVEDLKSLFVYAPDTRVSEHPIKIGAGDFTAVSGVFEGTFTLPMPLPDGGSIPPTGKTFSLDMVTIGRWKDGVMVEEWLMWDNLTFMKQIGLM